ncbi:hypothetical protein AL755_03090 (plasmid) [Arthrobacter sp. ERGS1:01]|nr:hypothetical protein AL755_03090 [Arthrobacter sp. ERGS1:01]
MVAESQGGEPQESVALSEDGQPYGQLTAPFAMDANGGKIPSTYTVAGNTVTQEFTVTASTVYPITLAPAYLRDGHSEDAEVSANYHQMLLNIPGDNAGDGGPQLRLAGVSIPSNYIYNPKMSPKELHDYCAWSPDSFGNANFRGSCARHDLCLEKIMWMPTLQRKVERSKCDAGLHTNLFMSCNLANNSFTAPACRTVAVTYYVAVSANTWTFG